MHFVSVLVDNRIAYVFLFCDYPAELTALRLFLVRMQGSSDIRSASPSAIIGQALVALRECRAGCRIASRYYATSCFGARLVDMLKYLACTGRRNVLTGTSPLVKPSVRRHRPVYTSWKYTGLERPFVTELAY